MRLLFIFSLFVLLHFTPSYAESIMHESVINSYADAAVQQSNNVIRGKVVDVKGEPIPGVNITLKSMKGGYITDIDGKFEIQTKNDSETIKFSFIGFQTQELSNVKKGTVLEIVLLEDVGTVDEVVITGFVPKSKVSYTGSQTTVNKKELLAMGTKNLFESLQAFVPGMLLVENNLSGSDPNKRPDINIRGRASFEGVANLPLFVVDGTIVTVDYIYDMDMNDIETVTVLKDASASALYGAKASAGVIVITTKVLEGGKLKLNYSGTLRASMPDLSDYRLLHSADKLEFERLAGVYTSDNGEEQYRKDLLYNEIFQKVRKGIDTDWISKPLRSGLSHNHSLSFDGGDEYARYNVGIRYGKDQGVMKGSDRSRLSTFFKFSYNRPGKFYVSNTSSITMVNSNDSPYGSFSDYVSQNPYDSPYDDNGKLKSRLTHNKVNPLYDASLGSYRDSESFDIMNTTNLQLWLGKDFRIDADFSIQKNKIESNKFVSPFSASEIIANKQDLTKRGSLTESNSKYVGYSGKLMGSYNTYLFDKLFISNTAGANFESYDGTQSAYKSIGYYTDKLAHPGFASGYPIGGKPEGSDEVKRAVGFFINSNAIFDNKYFLDLIYRYEGSSKFGKNQRFAPFWSIGGGWNLHNEKFFSGISVQTFKIRGSVGYLGNISFSPYQAITTYEYIGTLNYLKGIGAVPKTIGNPELKWERTLNTNFGLDITMFSGRWDFSLDYYIKNTDNLLLDVSKAPSVGVSTVRENIGSIENRGLEFRTKVVPIQNKDWYWGLSMNFSHNKNKIKSISNALKRKNEENIKDKGLLPLPIYEEGESLTALKVVPSAGIDPATGREIFIKADGSYSFIYDARDKKIFGDTNPYGYGSITSYLTYKNFSLNMSFGYSFGGIVYNQTLVSRVEGLNPINNADERVFKDRWKKPGDIAKFKDIADSTTPLQTSRFVKTNNYLTMQSLSVAYDLEAKFLNKLNIRRMRLELLTNDLFYISSVKRERGLSYPFERSVEMSVRFSL